MNVIYDVIDDFNEEYSDYHLEKTPNTILFGPGRQLDSLGFVNLIVAVEERLCDETGQSLTLADEKAMSRQNSPFRTIATLSEYIQSRLEEQS
ncbi:MAG: acyl carrier protein [Candidatus Omnitrophica bacterium]|nr:acyl carrier protein [Candidatus Omnitrophota bacterium]